MDDELMAVVASSRTALIELLKYDYSIILDYVVLHLSCLFCDPDVDFYCKFLDDPFADNQGFLDLLSFLGNLKQYETRSNKSGSDNGIGGGNNGSYDCLYNINNVNKDSYNGVKHENEHTTVREDFDEECFIPTFLVTLLLRVKDLNIVKFLAHLPVTKEVLNCYLFWGLTLNDKIYTKPHPTNDLITQSGSIHKTHPTNDLITQSGSIHKTHPTNDYVSQSDRLYQTGHNFAQLDSIHKPHHKSSLQNTNSDPFFISNLAKTVLSHLKPQFFLSNCFLIPNFTETSKYEQNIDLTFDKITEMNQNITLISQKIFQIILPLLKHKNCKKLFLMFVHKAFIMSYDRLKMKYDRKKVLSDSYTLLVQNVLERFMENVVSKGLLNFDITLMERVLYYCENEKDTKGVESGDRLGGSENGGRLGGVANGNSGSGVTNIDNSIIKGSIDDKYAYFSVSHEYNEFVTVIFCYYLLFYLASYDSFSEKLKILSTQYEYENDERLKKGLKGYMNLFLSVFAGQHFKDKTYFFDYYLKVCQNKNIIPKNVTKFCLNRLKDHIIDEGRSNLVSSSHDNSNENENTHQINTHQINTQNIQPDTPSHISNTSPNMSNTPPHISNTPPHISNKSSHIADTSPCQPISPLFTTPSDPCFYFHDKHFDTIFSYYITLSLFHKHPYPENLQKVATILLNQKSNIHKKDKILTILEESKNTKYSTENLKQLIKIYLECKKEEINIKTEMRGKLQKIFDRNKKIYELVDYKLLFEIVHDLEFCLNEGLEAILKIKNIQSEMSKNSKIADNNSNYNFNMNNDGGTNNLNRSSNINDNPNINDNLNTNNNPNPNYITNPHSNIDNYNINTNPNYITNPHSNIDNYNINTNPNYITNPHSNIDNYNINTNPNYITNPHSNIDNYNINTNPNPSSNSNVEDIITEEQRRTTELHRTTQIANNSFKYTNNTLKTILNISKINEKIFENKMVKKNLINVLNYNSKLLVNKCSQFSIKNMDKYSFKPKDLLRSIVELYIFLEDLEYKKTFKNMKNTENINNFEHKEDTKESYNRQNKNNHKNESKKDIKQNHESLLSESMDNTSTNISSNLINYNLQIFQKTFKICSEKQILVKSDLEKLNKIITNLKNIEEPETTKYPEKYLDPLTFELMTNPVLLKTSNIIVDKETADMILLGDGLDPFNRMELKENDIIEDEELKREIHEFLNK